MRTKPGRRRMSGFFPRIALCLADAVLLIFPLSGAETATRFRSPVAVDGVLDLRGYASGTVRLEGEWLFIPGRLLGASEAASAGNQVRRVPDLWKSGVAGGEGGRGVGTYRLRVLFDGPRFDLGIRYTTVSTAFELEVNGKTIAAAGRPDTDPARAIAAYRPGVARFDAPDGVADILVRVSNHEYRTGGLWRVFTLGPAETLIESRHARELRAFFIAAILAALSLNAFGMGFFRPREKGFFYYGVFTFLVALRVLATGEYSLVSLFPSLSFDGLIRLEYLTAYFIFPAGILYLFNFIPDEAGRGLKAALLVPFGLLGSLLPWAPLPLLTSSVLVLYPLAITAMLLALGLVLLAVHRHRRGAKGTLVAGVLLMIAAGLEMLFQAFLVQTPSILNVTLAIFLLAQSLLLSRRMVFAFESVETLSADLSRSNALLESENRRIREMHSRLEALLKEKETNLQEIHHRVKNSLQIVSSVIGLQAHRLADPEAASAFASLKERIRAVSLVHEKLYGSGPEDLVDLGEYTGELIRHLENSFGVETGSLDYTFEAVSVSLDMCIDLGLVLTELITNAFRHGFLPRGGGLAAVRLRVEQGILVMIVEDDGPGYPEGFSPNEAKSLGFKIVTSIVRKRHGRIDFASTKGARAEVRIPLGPESRVDTPGQGSARSDT